jgi:hypothetical protein
LSTVQLVYINLLLVEFYSSSREPSSLQIHSLFEYLQSITSMGTGSTYVVRESLTSVWIGIYFAMVLNLLMVGSRPTEVTLHCRAP